MGIFSERGGHSRGNSPIAKSVGVGRGWGAEEGCGKGTRQPLRSWEAGRTLGGRLGRS